VTALPNGWDGVEVVDAGSNTIGGLEPGAGNVIAGSGMPGVQILRFDAEEHADDNKVLGNKIGTDATETLDLGNSQSGVWIEGGIRTEVGGSEAGAANTIAYNGDDGVTVVSGQDNPINRNAIFIPRFRRRQDRRRGPRCRHDASRAGRALRHRDGNGPRARLRDASRRAGRG
jgi:hypothetical protein